jgi:hypothetical protein
MKAYVTSIGEITTDLCVWSLERNGFEVVLIKDPNTTLAQKLKQIYEMADDDFVRVDADVVPNRNLKPENLITHFEFEWWRQYKCYGWFSQDVIFGGIQFIKKEALPALRSNIDKFMNESRPETCVSRIKEFYDPRRFSSSDIVMGLHGFAAQDVERVMATKEERGQYANYDWELADKLMEITR